MKKLTALILSVLMLTGCLTLSVYAENKGDEKALQFNKDGKFTILNISDIQDGYPINPLTKDYIEKTNRRVTLEYILLKDVNDDVTNARQLAHYLRGLNVYVNLIPYNAVNEHGFKKSPASRIEAFKDELIRLRINCTLRKEHGGDIDGACGQLRAKKERRL